MGSGLSTLCPCFQPNPTRPDRTQSEPDPLHFAPSGPLDETLGHSFCYVRSSARFISPTPSDRFVSPTHSLRFDDPVHKLRPGSETGFKTISGASVSANAYTPKTVLQVDNIYDSATDDNSAGASGVVNVNGFESTASFSALPLQPVPRGDQAGGVERGGGFFMSGPIERGALSGPLDSGGGGGDGGGRVPFSAPLGGMYVKKKRKKGVSVIPKALYRNFSEKKQGSWVVPVLNFVGRRDNGGSGGSVRNEGDESAEGRSESNVQWALGKAGEDRVHVVVSEEQGWLFVGIYDGFNGPDAPEFLMSNLYRCVFNELRGLFWELEEDCEDESKQEELRQENVGCENAQASEVERNSGAFVEELSKEGEGCSDNGDAKKVIFQGEDSEIRPQRRRLWEFLAEENMEEGLDLSGSDRFAFSVDDAISVSKEGSAESRRWMLLSKLKHGLGKGKEGGQGRGLFPWKLRFEDKEKAGGDNRVDNNSSGPKRRRKEGPVDPDLVLRAMERALEVTENAYLDLTNKVLDTYPELALMGSCLLVALMRDEDVYVMNVGDSRALVAQYEQAEHSSSSTMRQENDRSNVEGITEESLAAGPISNESVYDGTAQSLSLTALQLSTDHSTSIEEEIIRIKNEHPDDRQCIMNDRVKGRLKVTRAFGAGFLKQPKFNDVLLEMFRNEYIGTAPYISCSPSLRHHKLCPSDQFLILSSDGLYQYLSNEEVVSQVESFMEKFPDGDPAQHLIEELLTRAAKKAGLGFHELLDIPQGDRRKYHDDVTVMVISLEGRIWKSSGKYI